jgi:hypothetical protein
MIAIGDRFGTYGLTVRVIEVPLHIVIQRTWTGQSPCYERAQRDVPGGSSSHLWKPGWVRPDTQLWLYILYRNQTSIFLQDQYAAALAGFDALRA